jgi:hypothetical protein
MYPHPRKEEFDVPTAKVWARITAADEPLLRRLYGVDALMPSSAHLPGRLVVDATATTPELARTARYAGIPYLVDPQTHYLQDWQPDGDRWAQLPYARREVMTPADLSSAVQRTALIEPLIQFQLSAQASTLVAPYVHIDQPDSAWIDVQAQLWRSTRQVLDRHGVVVPVVGVLAVGWRCLSPISGLAMLEPLWAALAELGPSDVAVAASRVHLGGNTDERLVDLLLLVEGLSRRHRVIAWQQGLFGEACVAAGASGYETGIGWRESCDMQRAMTTRRSLRASDAHPGARPVYLPDLGRSVPKSTIKAINSNDQTLWQRLVCPDVSCCAPGGANLMRDARRHAMVARSTALETINAAARPEWAWGTLAEKARRGLDLGNRINLIASRPVDLRVLEAIAAVATARRQRSSRFANGTMLSQAPA